MITNEAVAANISITRPLVNIPRAAENNAVNMPTIPSRHFMLSIEYNTTVEATGSTEATMVPNKVLR